MSRRSQSLWWLAVPILALAFVITDSVVRSRHILRVSASYGVTVDPPAVDPGSPTGYEHGLRSMLLPESGEDTAHWIMQTQEMISRGEWRLRHVDYDNSPRGRDVHWAAPYHWWLAGLAWIDHAVSGRPAGISVEYATLTSGAVMFGLWLLILMPILGRQFSGVAAALAAAGAVAAFPFYTDFLPGRADHHGLVNICSMLAVMLLAAGSQETGKTTPGVRRWFVGSALAAGVGLWVSAATLVPVLIGIGLGVLAAGWLGRREPERIAWLREPGLFRLWGWVGGGTSLVAYLIEYFPAHLGLRLEVNHPLYAVAWIGAGELLRLAARALGGSGPLERREVVAGAIGAGCVILLPAIILVTAARTFVVADPFVWQLHTRYISEFQGLARSLAASGLTWNFAGLVLPSLLLVPAVAAVCRPLLSPFAKSQLVLALCPAVVGWIQGWNQVRWLGLAYALSVPVVAIFFREMEREGKSRRTILAWAAACGLLFVPGAVQAARQTLAGADFTTAEIRNLAQRDVAHWLRQRAGREPVVVAGSPTGTTMLISEGGVTGVDTLYWENAEGLRNAAALFAAPSADSAHELVRRLGVTHIVFFSWDPFEIGLAKLARNLPADAPVPNDTFIVQLLAAPVPPSWLRAIPFTLPEHSALAGQQVRIWEVTPEQTPAEAAAHAANFYLETGRPDPSQQIASALAGFGTDLSASVMLAGMESRQQDAAGFSAAMARVMAARPQAGSLALDDHVHLVVVLAVAQQLELARAQLQACVTKVDERSLRHLTPGTLSDLLSLCEGLRVELPDPALKQLATQLTPPIRRK
ncbi:MAG TPA: hypothetical protein VG838_12940 [Opitutaceae bacterium]|nr:hypothetical protein [Opitutaceae bacterium]